MKTASVLTIFVAAAWAIPHPVPLDEEWNQYKKSFGKFYTSEDENVRRLSAYLTTKQKVEEHNRKYERGETSFIMGINEFADWFPEELNKLNGFKLDVNQELEERKALEVPPGVEVPEEMDWVKKGAVTKVKNQGNCGSCYAFSAIGALEGLMYVTNKTITDLSPQELIDCTVDDGNAGCDGGWMNTCFSYVARREGISTDRSYTYEAAQGQCRADKGQVGAACTGFETLKETEDDLKKAVGTISPVSIAFAVDEDFIKYEKGIYDGNCASLPNHGMLAVGYGKDKKTGKDYWLVKNSWGEYWGMKGYVKIIRGVNKCRINGQNSYPVYVKSAAN